MAVDAPKNVFKNPVACASAFGRFFYAVGSTVYFSQVLQSSNDAGRCYQQNDPTSSEIPDLLDTDGGVIELEDSRRIKAITPFRSGILVFAGNGVWFIFNPDGGFKATAYNVDKITERGLDSVKSIVTSQTDVYYFSSNGIVRIAISDLNNPTAIDITENSIRSHFLEFYAGQEAQGIYDAGKHQCNWWLPAKAGRGLIYDVQLEAFYPQKQANTDYNIISPFTIVNAAYYPSTLESESSLSYSFASPKSKDFKDFGTDQSAYLITGYETLGKFANKKSASQAKVFFRKTETSITGYTDGSYTFDAPSSCLFQSRWDFDNTNAYSKFVGKNSTGGKGKKMQLYKPMQRGFTPDAYPYTFDTGESLISQKFTIRGNGDAVQFMFEAEAEKDMQLLGYSVNYTMRSKM